MTGSTDFSHWHDLLEVIAKSGNLASKKRSYKLAKKLLEEQQSDKESDSWYGLEVSSLTLLCDIAQESANSDYQTQLVTAFTERPRKDNRAEIQLDMGYIKVLRHANTPAVFLTVCVRQEALLTKRPTEEQCELFVSVVCRAATFPKNQREAINQSLLRSLDHYQAHLRMKIDPIMLICSLAGLEPPFLTRGAQIAVARFRGDYRYTPCSLNSLEWKKQQVYHKLLIERLLNTYEEENLKLVHELLQIPQACSAFQDELRHEYIATTIVQKLLSLQMFPAASKKIVDFLNHLRGTQFCRKEDGLPAASCDLAVWVHERKQSISLRDFSTLQVLLNFLTVYGDYLERFFIAKKPFQAKCLDAYFKAVILSDINKEGQEVSSLLSASPQAIVAAVVKRVITAPIKDEHVKKVFLCSSLLYLQELIRLKGLPKEVLLPLIEQFIADENLFNTDLAYFHNYLCQMLLDALEKHKYEETLKDLFKKLIENTLKRQDHFASSKAVLLIGLVHKTRLSISADTLLEWISKLLIPLKAKEEVSLPDFQIIISLAETSIALFKEAKPNKYLSLKGELDLFLYSRAQKTYGSNRRRVEGQRRACQFPLLHQRCQDLSLQRSPESPPLEDFRQAQAFLQEGPTYCPEALLDGA